MRKILIIDDEPAIANFLARLVKGLGHASTVRFNAKESLEELENDSFSLIISDILLPDAPDEIAWLDQLCLKAGETPVVLISGRPSPELVACAEKHEVLAFLSKPFELAFIKSILQTALPVAT